MNEFDIAIIGGGLAGASLACAIEGLGLDVVVVEAVPPAAADQPSFDARALALGYGSRRIFEAMGLWGAIEREGATAIRTIHVSERGGFGVTRLTAGDEGVPALGYVAESRALGNVLGPALAALPRCRLLAPAQVTSVESRGDRVEVGIDTAAGPARLGARLLVAADGGRSRVRELLRARSWRRPYGQTAVIANVVTDRPHANTAYERFTDTGPVALLPCDRQGDAAGRGCRWSLVWTVRDEQVEETLAYDDAEFLARLQARFGRRAGRMLGVSPRSAYPLGIEYVRDLVLPRTALVGNAAHLIHPVAGQGFNLGLRDVAALAEVLADAVRDGEDIGADATLARYAQWRRPDYYRVMGFTDALVRTFSNRIPPLAAARNFALGLLDAVPSARHLLARQAMGLTGRLPRLACGLPLVRG